MPYLDIYTAQQLLQLYCHIVGNAQRLTFCTNAFISNNAEMGIAQCHKMGIAQMCLAMGIAQF